MVDTSPPCTIISTLAKVTELFSCSVNQLNKNQTDDNLKKVMENYDHMNMVMRVIKLAYPQCTIEQQQQQQQQSTNNMTTINPMVTPSPPPAHIKLESTQVNTSNNMFRDISPVAPPQPTVSHTTSKATTSTTTKTETMTAAANASVQHISHISPKEFLDQFEQTARSFAAQNKFIVADVWEKLFIHALPQDKLDWANKHILNRNLSWYEARQIYLKTFNNQHQSTPSPPPNMKPHPSGLRPSRTINPLPTPPPSDDTEEQKIIRKRQEQYAEYFLALEMKEYETIGDYNTKFRRYIQMANLNLGQSDLIRRYLNSLLKGHKESMQALLESYKQRDKQCPTKLEDMMLLTEKVIKKEKSVKDRIYAQPCWQKPTGKRELSDSSCTRPSKRYSSSCA